MPWTDDLNRIVERLADVFPGEEQRIDLDQRTGGAGLNGHSEGETGAGRQLSVDKAQAALIAAESRQAEERGRSQGMEAGIEEGLNQGRRESIEQVETERSKLYAQAVALAESFAHSQSQYFHQVEEETVRLALAIAARILRREAQMDPLLLTGAVRVALGQVAELTAVRLRVPEPDQPMWEQAVGRIPRLALRPQVIGDPHLQLGDCRMETELGSADLGLWAQLKEIESGFFDRVHGAEASGPAGGEGDSADDSGRVGAPSGGTGGTV